MIEQSTSSACRCGGALWLHGYGPLWYCAKCGASARQPSPSMAELIARSSLGTPEARAARATAPRHIVDAVLRRAVDAKKKPE